MERKSVSFLSSLASNLHISRVRLISESTYNQNKVISCEGRPFEMLGSDIDIVNMSIFYLKLSSALADASESLQPLLATRLLQEACSWI